MAKKESIVYMGKKNPKVVEAFGKTVEFVPEETTEVPSEIASLVLEKAGDIFKTPKQVKEDAKAKEEAEAKAEFEARQGNQEIVSESELPKGKILLPEERGDTPA